MAHTNLLLPSSRSHVPLILLVLWSYLLCLFPNYLTIPRSTSRRSKYATVVAGFRTTAGNTPSSARRPFLSSCSGSRSSKYKAITKHRPLLALLLPEDSSKFIKSKLNQNIDTYKDLFRKVDKDHEIDSRLAPFAVEQPRQEKVDGSKKTVVLVDDSPNSSIATTDTNNFSQMLEQFINPVTGDTVAVRSTPTCPPILNSTSIQMLREAAEKLWEDQRMQTSNTYSSSAASSSSRFTYQSKNNYEAHVQDLFQFNPHIQPLMDELLLHKVYPILRYAFGGGSNRSSTNSTNHIAPLSKENFPYGNYLLSVYDSLIIRYDATNTNGNDKSSSSSAGQPFHRDLGLCSMNIALNSPTINSKNDKVYESSIQSKDTFLGGGTFFENLVHIRKSIGDNETNSNSSTLILELQRQLNNNNNNAIIRPMRAGGFVGHPCSERHAGVVTTSGIRDILVIFVTAQQQQDDDMSHEKNTNHTDRSMIMATTNSHCCPKSERVARLKGLARYATSVEEKQCCYHAALMEDPNDGEAWQFLGMSLLQDCNDVESAIQCLEIAKHHSPMDSRVYNNLGLAYRRQQEEKQKQYFPYDTIIEECYLQSVRLNSIAVKSGVMTIDYESALLNLGLFYANRDDFASAYDVLSLIVDAEEEHQKQHLDNSHHYFRVMQDSKLLLDLCKRRLGKGVVEETAIAS
jgi:tetratricopeptide (TPR) repeat protein